jgi:hypothetical protein
MNKQAAKELLDLIMLDEFVARREALNLWSRRWIATMYVEAAVDGNALFGGILDGQATNGILREIFAGLMHDEAHVLNWGNPADENGKPRKNVLACEMHCIMQVPKDPGDIDKAAQAMKAMAKGEKP